jgi:hypothetical protein
MRRLIGIIGLAYPFLAGAQQQRVPPLQLAVGDSVRLRARNGEVVAGTFVRQTADSVAIRRAGAIGDADSVVAFKALSAVEARLPRHTGTSLVPGLVLGAIAGGGVGAIAGDMMDQRCTGDICVGKLLLIPAGVLLGGIIGGVVGAVRTSDVWDIVWQPPPDDVPI